MGFDGFFFARSDYLEREQRMVNQSMEFLWRPQFDHLGTKAQIYANLLYIGYSSPPFIKWDTDNTNDDFVDDPALESFNADEICEFIYLFLKTQTLFYRSTHLLLPLGGDFSMQDAYENYDSTGRFIKYFNKKFGEEFQLMYSTPSKYLDAIIATNFSLPTTYNDMVPYADFDNSFWSGFYTSRAN